MTHNAFQAVPKDLRARVQSASDDSLTTDIVVPTWYRSRHEAFCFAFSAGGRHVHVPWLHGTCTIIGTLQY